MAEDRAVPGLTMKESVSSKDPEDRHSKHVPLEGEQAIQGGPGLSQRC